MHDNTPILYRVSENYGISRKIMAQDNSQLLQQIVNFLVSLFSKNAAPAPVPLTPEPKAAPPAGIDWTNPKAQITAHFTVEDACMLHSWNRLANESDGLNDLMKNLLIATCQKMEQVRDLLGCPIDVHCIYRSEGYNTSQNIKPAKDVHSMGLACDFDCGPHLTIEQVKAKLEPQLAQTGIRLERGTTTWIHVDTHAVGPSGRYFTA
jgi:hypothetical protein